jgi:hypothetical protein
LIRRRIRRHEDGEFNGEQAEAVHVAEYERKIAELEGKAGQLAMEAGLLKRGRGWDSRSTARATPS